MSLLLLVGCDSSDEGPDAGVVCDPFEAIARGDDGHADPLAAPAGQARAGRLTAAQLPEDPTGLGTYEAGDFVLANDRVALIVEAEGESDLYDPYGGRPVGIAAVEGGALVRAGDFNEILFGFGSYLVGTEDVSVIADGADGGPAILRARGPMAPLEFAGELLSGLIQTDDFTGLPAAMEYEMAPGSDAVEVYLRVQQDRPEIVARTPMILTAFFQRYRMPLFSEPGGFVVPTVEYPMAAFVDDAATSYAWLAPEGAAHTPVLDQSGVLAVSIGRGIVEACTEARIHLGTIVVGGPGLAGLQASLARESGTALRTVTGTVEEADGAPATDVRVHVRRADGALFARLVPEADGSFSIDVPEEAVTFFAYRQGTPLVGPVEVAASAETVALEMPGYGTIRVTVTDTGDPASPIPARVQVVPVGGAPEIPADLGEISVGDGRAHVAFTTSGAVDLRVAPGEHDVIVSRGFEYEIFTTRDPLTVGVGEVVEVAAALDHVVETPDVMCADYHIHTHRSPDSPDSPQLKLTGLIADGVEIAIRSDHEWVNDFQPVIDEMGLSAFARGIGGEELTTFAWGHFGVFPLVEDPSRPNQGAVPWVGRLPPAVFDDVRARPEEPVLIINHPRSGGALGGYFSAAGLDPETGTSTNTDYWDEEFTIVEVFNDESFEEARETNVADWLSLLRAGRRVYAVGSSDSHGIYGSPVGYPRTCIAVGTDDPTALTPERVRDETAAGHSVISGGIYLSVVGPDGAGPGDMVSGAGASATFEVSVWAPSWITGLTGLEVIVDGETVETIEMPADGPDALRPTLRMQADVDVPVAEEGSYVIFHAGSAADLAPVHPGRDAFGVSNPVFLTR